jgi:hypothetical protein
MKREGISRRNFIKGAAVAGAALTTVGVETAEAHEPWLPKKWDAVADIVTVGGGGLCCDHK